MTTAIFATLDLAIAVTTSITMQMLQSIPAHAVLVLAAHGAFSLAGIRHPLACHLQL